MSTYPANLGTEEPEICIYFKPWQSIKSITNKCKYPMKKPSLSFSCSCFSYSSRLLETWFSGIPFGLHYSSDMQVDPNLVLGLQTFSFFDTLPIAFLSLERGAPPDLWEAAIGLALVTSPPATSGSSNPVSSHQWPQSLAPVTQPPNIGDLHLYHLHLGKVSNGKDGRGWPLDAG